VSFASCDRSGWAELCWWSLLTLWLQGDLLAAGTLCCCCTVGHRSGRLDTGWKAQVTAHGSGAFGSGLPMCKTMSAPSHSHILLVSRLCCMRPRA
jgi:hypothetical protein